MNLLVPLRENRKNMVNLWKNLELTKSIKKLEYIFFISNNKNKWTWPWQNDGTPT